MNDLNVNVRETLSLADVIFYLPPPSIVGQNYYVDATGGLDSNTGTDSGHPWKTISKVNGQMANFHPGDQILFKKGESWTEQLVVSASGSSSGAIIFSSYGSGSKPLIDLADSLAFGIYTNGTSYLVFRDIEIANAKDDSSASVGVALLDTNNVTLYELTITDIKGVGGVFIMINTAGRGINNLVKSSTITGTSSTTYSLAQGNKGVGLYVLSGDVSYGSGNIFEDNTITGNGSHGIGLFSPNTKILNNIVSQNGEAGIGGSGLEVHDTLIQYNFLEENCQTLDDCFGINLFRVGVNNIVDRNTTRAQHDTINDPSVPINPGSAGKLGTGGIRFDGGDIGLGPGLDYIDSLGNVITNNTISDEYDAIQVWNFDYIGITGNTISGSTRAGLYAGANNTAGEGGATKVISVIFTGNFVTGTGVVIYLDTAIVTQDLVPTVFTNNQLAATFVKVSGLDDGGSLDPSSPSVSQSFTVYGVDQGGYLSYVGVVINRQTTPGAGTIVAKLYSHSGTYSTSSAPGTLLATSLSKNISDISAIAQFVYFDFSPSAYWVEPGRYVLTVETSGADSNGLAIWWSNNGANYGKTSPTVETGHTGNGGVYYTGTGWVPLWWMDLNFAVYLSGWGENLITGEDVSVVFQHNINVFDSTLHYQNLGTIDNASYSESHHVGNLSLGGGGAPIMPTFGETFTTTNWGILNKVQFYLRKLGAPTGTAVATIYDIHGTYGVDATPLGQPLATSETFDVSTLTTTNQLKDFIFSDEEKIELLPDHHYAVAITYLGGNTSNYLGFSVDNSTLAYPGNFFWREYEGGGWTAYTGYDASFHVWTETNNVAEEITLIRDLGINVFESRAITENVEKELSSLTLSLSVVDANVLADVPEVSRIHLLSPGDDISISDIPEVKIEWIISVSDSLSISEYPTPTDYRVLPLVSDSISITEGVSVQTGATLGIDQNDTLSVVDTPTLSRWHVISTSEDITIVDSPTVRRDPSFSVSDSLSLGEDSIAMIVDNALLINVWDTPALSDSPLLEKTSIISVSDSLNLSEAISRTLVFNVSVNDSLLIGETAGGAESFNILVNDSLGLTDFPESALSALTISTTEDLSISEGLVTPPVNLSLTPIDSLSADESVTLAFDSFASQVETLTLNDSAIVSIEDLLIIVWEAPQLVEVPNTQFDQPGLIPGEDIEISEIVSILSGDINVITSESQTITEDVFLRQDLTPVDAISITEIVMIQNDREVEAIELLDSGTFEYFSVDLGDLSIGVNETQEISESLDISCVEYPNINVNDFLAIGEIITAQSDDLNISKTENLSISEGFLYQAGELEINLNENVSVSDSLTNISLNLNIEIVEFSPLLLDGYSETYYSTPSTFYSTIHEYGQAFKANQTAKINSVKFYLSAHGTILGTAVAKLYLATGTPGIDAKGSGSPLATSDPFDVTSIGVDTYGLYSFNFSGVNKYQIQAGVSYAIVLYYDVTLDPFVDYLSIGFDTYATVHGGNKTWRQTGGYWNFNAGDDLIFYLYGDNDSMVVPITEDVSLQLSRDIPPPGVIDLIPILDVPTLSISNLEISVTDELEISEDLTLLFGSILFPGDDILISENLLFEMVSFIEEVDSISNSESLNVFILDISLTTSPSDPLEISELATVQSEDLSLLVADELSISEISEGEEILLKIDTSDAVGISDEAALAIWWVSSIGETLSISESVIVTLSDLNILVSDSLEIGEQVVSFPAVGGINPGDDISIKEDISFWVEEPSINFLVSDTLTITEDAEFSSGAESQSGDSLNISDVPIVSIEDIPISVNDIVLLTESSTPDMVRTLGASEALTVSDVATVGSVLQDNSIIVCLNQEGTAHPGNYSIFSTIWNYVSHLDVIFKVLKNGGNSVSISEYVLVEFPRDPLTGEDLTISEDVQLEVFINLEASEDILIEDFVEVVLSDIEMSEAITISEDVTVSLEDMVIEVSEPISIEDSLDIEILIDFFSDDSLTIEEDITINIEDLTISTDEEISSNEVLELTLDDLIIEVTEDILSEEDLTFEGPSIDIDVSDGVEITEAQSWDNNLAIALDGDIHTSEEYLGVGTIVYQTLNGIVISERAQSFISRGNILDSVKFQVATVGSPTGVTYAKIYVHSGTYGTTSVPSGEALATSEAVDVSTISTTPSLVTFSFSGDQRIPLSSQYYCVAIYYLDGDAGNYLSIGYTDDQYSGNESYYLTGADYWQFESDRDLIFSISTENYSEPLVIEDDVTVATEDLAVDVSDILTITDFVGDMYQGDLWVIGVSDLLTIEEDLTVTMDDIAVILEEDLVNEEFLTEEDVTISLGIDLEASEDIVVTEDVSSSPLNEIDISDNLSLEEEVTTITENLEVGAWEDISLSELASAFNGFELSTSETVEVLENVTFETSLNLEASEDIEDITDFPEVETGILSIFISDDLSPEETLDFSQTEDLWPSLLEGIFLSETVFLLCEDLVIEVSDDIIIIDEVDSFFILANREVAVTDDISPLDIPFLNLDILLISVVEDIGTEEDVTIFHEEFPPVWDGISITEEIILENALSDIDGTYDILTIEDSVEVVLVSLISVDDSLTISGSVVIDSVRYSPGGFTRGETDVQKQRGEIEVKDYRHLVQVESPRGEIEKPSPAGKISNIEGSLKATKKNMYQRGKIGIPMPGTTTYFPDILPIQIRELQASTEVITLFSDLIGIGLIPEATSIVENISINIS